MNLKNISVSYSSTISFTDEQDRHGLGSSARVTFVQRLGFIFNGSFATNLSDCSQDYYKTYLEYVNNKLDELYKSEKHDLAMYLLEHVEYSNWDSLRSRYLLDTSVS